MKISMILMVALLLSGCGKKAEVGSETSVEMSYSNYEALISNQATKDPPVVVLIAENESGIKLVKSIQENFNFSFPNGSWRFYVMSWNWATPVSGGNSFILDNYAAADPPQPSRLYCGFQDSVNLTGQPVTLQINLAQANCDESLNLAPNSPRFWVAYPTSPPANSPLLSYHAIWSIVGYNQLTGENEGEIFKSSCKILNSSVTGNLSPILPLIDPPDAPIKFKFRFVVRIYPNNNCNQDELKYSLIYPNSLRSIPFKIKHAVVAADPTFTVYLKGSNDFNGAPVTLGPTIPISNANISTAEASTDDSTN
jgi:hypothetical protein